MTEEEAKTKWCPFVQKGIQAEERGPDNMARCIASACMAWRALDPGNPGDKPIGYCGLAGTPHLRVP